MGEPGGHRGTHRGGHADDDVRGGLTEADRLSGVLAGGGLEDPQSNTRVRPTAAWLPVPLLLGLRLVARRPRRVLLSAASLAVTRAGAGAAGYCGAVAPAITAPPVSLPPSELGLAMTGAAPEESMWDHVRRLHDHHGDVPVEMRLLKLTEEVGEAAEAFIGLRGPNARKGVCRSRADLLAELADVIITAAVAMSAVTGADVGEARGHLERRLTVVTARAGL